MNKKTRSNKSEKWRHTCNSVKIAWTNEPKVAVTSYGRNKNHDDEIKKNQEKANNSPSYRCAAIKHKPTNVGRIALDRQASEKTFDPVGIRTTDLSVLNQMHWPLGYQSLVYALLQPTSY